MLRVRVPLACLALFALLLATQPGSTQNQKPDLDRLGAEVAAYIRLRMRSRDNRMSSDSYLSMNDCIRRLATIKEPKNGKEYATALIEIAPKLGYKEFADAITNDKIPDTARHQMWFSIAVASEFNEITPDEFKMLVATAKSMHAGKLDDGEFHTSFASNYLWIFFPSIHPGPLVR